MIKSPIHFVYIFVFKTPFSCFQVLKTQSFLLRSSVGFVDLKFKFCCGFWSWMFLNHRKWITSCFDGRNHVQTGITSRENSTVCIIVWIKLCIWQLFLLYFVLESLKYFVYQFNNTMELTARRTPKKRTVGSTTATECCNYKRPTIYKADTSTRCPPKFRQNFPDVEKMV